MPSAVTAPAILVRPANPSTFDWVNRQARAVRGNRNRNIGLGPCIDAMLTGLIEARVNFEDCHGKSEISSKLARLLDARFSSKEAR